MNGTERSGRERILHEAAQLFVSQGYNGISMREIGDASGMTKAALYYHFKDKQDLLREIIKTTLANTKKRFEKKAVGTDTIREQVSSLINEIFLQRPEERGILHLIFVEAPHLDESLRKEITCIYHDQFLSVIENLLQVGVERGEIKLEEPRLAARLLLGMMYPFIHPRHTETQAERQQAVDLMVSIFFDGVRP
jgi:AcrR family transcriptional regulator